MPQIKCSRPRVLLSSVFGPFACDDEYGSRAINPVELYQNQVTREQGPFSLRMFHRSWALWAMEKYLAHSNAGVAERIRDLRTEIHRELGVLSGVVAGLAGPAVLWTSRREARRFPTGRRMEPRSFVERVAASV